MTKRSGYFSKALNQEVLNMIRQISSAPIYKIGSWTIGEHSEIWDTILLAIPLIHRNPSSTPHMIMQFVVRRMTTTTTFTPHQEFLLLLLLNAHSEQSICVGVFFGSHCIFHWNIIARLLMPVFDCLILSLTTETFVMKMVRTYHMR